MAPPEADAAARLDAEHRAYAELCAGPPKPDLESAKMLAAWAEALWRNEPPDLAD